VVHADTTTALGVLQEGELRRAGGRCPVRRAARQPDGRRRAQAHPAGAAARGGPGVGPADAPGSRPGPVLEHARGPPGRRRGPARHGRPDRPGAPYDRFEHRVDQSIQRDVLVAVKR
jgi:hypothetical protein